MGNMERLSDNYYVEKTLSGDAGSFAPLLERYSKQVFTLIVKIVGNREDAEELTQDVFVKAYGSLAKFRAESAFSTWIYRIAYNTAISATRKKRFDCIPIDEAFMPDVPDETFFEDADDDRRLEYLHRALEQIPPDERAMVMFFYKENRSMEEIAAITGLTETNVKTKMFRIRKKLLVLIKSMEGKSDGTER